MISLLNYPEVVKMMSGDLEWTQSLGDALANQQKEVLIAIQQLRDEAVAKEIIKSDDKIQVVESGDNVIIQPTIPRRSTSRNTSRKCSMRPTTRRSPSATIRIHTPTTTIRPPGSSRAR